MMERVIVSVGRAGDTLMVDLELSSDLPAGELARILPVALGWPGSGEYEIVVTPPGRVIRPEETLADAQAWDGATLTLKTPSRSGAASQSSASEPPGWRKVR